MQRRWYYDLGHLTPNGLLTITELHGKVKSPGYFQMLQSFAVKLMILNMHNGFWFIQDNCTVHKTKQVLEYLQSQENNVIDWFSEEVFTNSK